MTPVNPCVPVRYVPEGTRPVVKAEDQPHLYDPLPSLHTPDGVVITRWTLTEGERAQILRGEDVYIAISTFNAPLQPLRVSVGICDWSEV